MRGVAIATKETKPFSALNPPENGPYSRYLVPTRELKALLINALVPHETLILKSTGFLRQNIKHSLILTGSQIMVLASKTDNNDKIQQHTTHNDFLNFDKNSSKQTSFM